MEIRARFTISIGDRENLQALLKGKLLLEKFVPSRIAHWQSGTGFTFEFDYLIQNFQDLQAHLKEEKVSSSFSVHRSYTVEELNESEYLCLFGGKLLHSSRQGPLTRRKGEKCPNCRYAETIWNFASLQIKGNADGFQIGDVDWHPIAITESVANALVAHQLTGQKLIPVAGTKDQKWYILESENQLPPTLVPPTIHDPSPPLSRPCLLKHQLGIPYTELYYRRSHTKLLDFNKTFEWFGSDTQAMIISQRAYKLLKSLVGKQRISVEPIRLVEWIIARGQ